MTLSLRANPRSNRSGSRQNLRLGTAQKTPPAGGVERSKGEGCYGSRQDVRLGTAQKTPPAGGVERSEGEGCYGSRQDVRLAASPATRSKLLTSSATRMRGFTLLELLLTLSLTVVLMTLVNSAFQFYSVDMDAADVELRQTMLASAIMQMVEDDLRAALHPDPLDTTALEELLSATAASATGGAAATGTEQMSPEDLAAAGLDDPALASEEVETDSLVSGVAVLETPGLIGNQFQIQIDTSRIPRLEEYAMMLSANPAELVDLPSDLKTVTYYVQAAGSGIKDPLDTIVANAADPNQADSSQETGGLVRRILDRSATKFASISGNLSSLNQTGELLAPEVASISFTYWDGITWQIEWNSDELGELPLAVKIEMVMNPPMTLSQSDDATPAIFQHLVRLPIAKMIVEEEDELGTEVP